jgi:hypothetical protein
LTFLKIQEQEATSIVVTPLLEIKEEYRIDVDQGSKT